MLHSDDPDRHGQNRFTRHMYNSSTKHPPTKSLSIAKTPRWNRSKTAKIRRNDNYIISYTAEASCWPATASSFSSSLILQEEEEEEEQEEEVKEEGQEEEEEEISCPGAPKRRKCRHGGAWPAGDAVMVLVQKLCSALAVAVVRISQLLRDERNGLVQSRS